MIGSFSGAWMTKLETAQPFCECMLGPQAVRDAASDHYFRLFVAFDRLCPVLPSKRFSFSAAICSLDEFAGGGVYPEGVPTKG